MKISFISNNKDACGVCQYGRSIIDALTKHSKFEVTAFELESDEDYRNRKFEIDSCDLLIYNYHALTLPFLAKNDSHVKGKPVIGIIHEFDYATCYCQDNDLFKYRIMGDQSLASKIPGLFSIPRIVPQMAVYPVQNDKLTIGTFGFAFGDITKFCSVVKFAAMYFPNSHVKIHAPAGYYDSNSQQLCDSIIETSQKIAGETVSVTVNTDFLTNEELVHTLAANDLNVFLYHPSAGRGISSSTDIAMAAERPFCLSDSTMFRHLKYFAPELFLANSEPGWILRHGGNIVKALKRKWTPQNAAIALDEIFEQVLTDFGRKRVERDNTILDDRMRTHFAVRERELEEKCPAVFHRKISRTNVQQAFVRDKVLKYATRESKILCVGYHEDTAYFSLLADGFSITAIDPVYNFDLEQFHALVAPRNSFDIIFSTSVIEHVKDDRNFVAQLAELLAPGGVAILTMNFLNSYIEGSPVFPGSYRFYSEKRLLEEIVPRLAGCSLVDVPDWDESEPDFDYGGVRYSFATLVFRKHQSIDPMMENNDKIIHAILSKSVEKKLAEAERILSKSALSLAWRKLRRKMPKFGS